MSLIDLTVRDLVAAFRSPAPTPGGGSAAALAGAVGAALLAMAASLPRPRATTPEEVARLAAAGRRCGELSQELTVLIERDSDAYNAVIDAYRLPKTTEEEIGHRSSRIQDALYGATIAPLHVMRGCSAALEQAAAVATLGNRNASSDVQAGLELLTAGLRAAALNVEINLTSRKDQQQGADIRDEVSRLVRTSTDDAVAARRLSQEVG